MRHILVTLLLGLLPSTSFSQISHIPAALPATPTLSCDRVFPAGAPRTQSLSVINQSVLSDGGILDVSAASFQAAAIDDRGALIFFARVTNQLRNEGIFRKSGSTIASLVRGCSGGSGCGDFEPGGGTYEHIYTDGIQYGPSINSKGDVFFIATVTGGTYPRALFKFAGATGIVTKIAAEGDVGPGGGIISALGVADVSDTGHATFLLEEAGTTVRAAFWNGSSVSYIAGPGYPVPQGSIGGLGYWSLIDTQGYTTLVYGPSINASDDIVFGAYSFNPSGTAEGIYRWSGGQISTVVESGSNAPGGGQFSYFGTPTLNDRGEVAFFGGLSSNPAYDAGWYVARRGSVRLAAAKFTPLAPYGGVGVIGPLMINTAPFQNLDNCGNLIFHSEAYLGGSSFLDTIILAKENGYLEVLAQAGQSAPGGGTYLFFNLTPAINNRGQAVISPFIGGTSYANGAYVTIK